MEDLIGRTLGRYHIVEQLGKGGMAAVYKAYDTRLNRNVAIKVILPTLEQSEEFSKRFEREAKALGQLNHPNIVKVHDFGDQEGISYIVMEYLPGGSLRARMGKPLPYQEAARLTIPIARALAYAHQRKIIHRDIKPANILISESNEPMLTDFGIAKMIEAQETAPLTGTGVGIGTPEYMAPEQGMGKQVDERTDIYALGIVFYELVTGRKPFQADTPMAVMIKHMTDPLPRPRDFIADLPEEVERVIFTAVAKKPENRYRSMESFAEALEGLLHIIPTMSDSHRPVDRTAATLPLSQPGVGYPSNVIEPRSSARANGVPEPLGGRGTSPIVIEQPPVTQKPRKKSFLWVIIAVIAVVIGGGFCLVMGAYIFTLGTSGTATPTIRSTSILQTSESEITNVIPTGEDVQLGDLSNVKITLDDLPSGYKILTESDIQELGFTEEQLIGSMTSNLSEATIRNMTGYMTEDVEAFEIILSMLVYPLTSVERASFDLEILDPNIFLNNFTTGMSSTSTDPITVDILPDGDQVGDKSVGVSFFQSSSGVDIQGEAIVARRDRVILIAFVFFLPGSQPVPSISIAQILDAKLQNAMK